MVRARTLIGVAKEGQRQNLTVVAKDRSGKPLSGRVVLTAEHLFTTIELDESGTGTVRLPVGSYSGWLTADVQGANGPHSLGMALLAFNDVQLDQDRTVTLDGRKTRQILAHVPQQTTAVAPRLDVHRSFTDSLVESSMLPNETYDSIWALPTGKKVTDGEFEFGARFRLEQPALTVGTKSETYDDLLVKRAATPLPAASRKLTAVFAGEGTADGAGPAERARQGRGGTAQRHRSAIEEQAKAAAAAGARVLVVVNDGIGRLQPWDETPWSPQSPAPLTVATLNADQGADLIDSLQRGSVELKVTSHPTTDYLYDVVHHWSGAVPADPTWRVKPSDLARVDVSFRNYRPGKALEYRSDVWRGWAVGNQLTAPAQGERTDWVTPDADWLDDAFIVGETGQHSIDVLRYPAGKTGKVSWFGPIQRPRMGPIGYQPVRYLDTVYIPAPGWGDSGAGHVGEAHGNFDVKDWMSLYQGDRQLDWGNAEYLPVPGLAAERLPYRLVVDNDRAAWANPYSTHTLTEWNFTSAATGADVGRVPAADPARLRRGHRQGGPGGPACRADGDRLAPARHDGRHREALARGLVRRRDDLAAGRPEPAAVTDGGRPCSAPKSADFATLRVTARDSAGNSVSQTITRAFGLR